MDPKKKFELLRATAEEKSKFIDDRLEKLEELLDKYGSVLSKEIIDELLRELGVENGLILSDIQNQRKSQLVIKAYEAFMEKQGYKIITTMVADLYQLSGLNLDYFSKLQGVMINADDIQNMVNYRLGIIEGGGLKRQGFMKGLLDDMTVRNEIRDFVLEKITAGTGFEDLRKSLRILIAGEDGKMGKFKQFYRNTAYDTYARIDALNGKLFADKLNLKYFIYAGTRRKASRYFCINRKGKVFSRDEAMKWKDLIGTKTRNDKGKQVPAGPIVSVEDVDTYNPFVDRGGFGCVDDIMWISEEIAFMRRPDLKK